jgi:hypothetical protein
MRGQATKPRNFVRLFNQFNANNQWVRGAGDSYDSAGNQLSTAQVGSLGTQGSIFGNWGTGYETPN